MPRYCVYSPEMLVRIPVCEDGSGPMEPECCVCEIEARTKREAITRSIHHPEMRAWVDEARWDGKNPFIGLNADRIEPYPVEEY